MPDRSGHGGPWPWNNNNDARHRLRPYFPSRGPDNYHFNSHNGGGGQQHRPPQQQYPYNPSVNYFNNGDGQQHHHHHYHRPPPPPPPEQQVLPNQSPPIPLRIETPQRSNFTLNAARTMYQLTLAPDPHSNLNRAGAIAEAAIGAALGGNHLEELAARARDAAFYRLAPHPLPARPPPPPPPYYPSAGSSGSMFYGSQRAAHSSAPPPAASRPVAPRHHPEVPLAGAAAHQQQQPYVGAAFNQSNRSRANMVPNGRPMDNINGINGSNCNNRNEAVPNGHNGDSISPASVPLSDYRTLLRMHENFLMHHLQALFPLPQARPEGVLPDVVGENRGAPPNRGQNGNIPPNAAGENRGAPPNRGQNGNIPPNAAGENRGSLPNCGQNGNIPPNPAGENRGPLPNREQNGNIPNNAAGDNRGSPPNRGQNGNIPNNPAVQAQVPPGVPAMQENQQQERPAGAAEAVNGVAPRPNEAANQLQPNPEEMVVAEARGASNPVSAFSSTASISANNISVAPTVTQSTTSNAATTTTTSSIAPRNPQSTSQEPANSTAASTNGGSSQIAPPQSVSQSSAIPSNVPSVSSAIASKTTSTAASTSASLASSLLPLENMVNSLLPTPPPSSLSPLSSALSALSSTSPLSSALSALSPSSSSSSDSERSLEINLPDAEENEAVSDVDDCEQANLSAAGRSTVLAVTTTVAPVGPGGTPHVPSLLVHADKKTLFDQRDALNAQASIGREIRQQNAANEHCERPNTVGLPQGPQGQQPESQNECANESEGMSSEGQGSAFACELPLSLSQQSASNQEQQLIAECMRRENGLSDYLNDNCGSDLNNNNGLLNSTQPIPQSNSSNRSTSSDRTGHAVGEVAAPERLQNVSNHPVAPHNAETLEKFKQWESQLQSSIGLVKSRRMCIPCNQIYANNRYATSNTHLDTLKHQEAAAEWNAFLAWRANNNLPLRQQCPDFAAAVRNHPSNHHSARRPPVIASSASGVSTGGSRFVASSRSLLQHPRNSAAAAESRMAFNGQNLPLNLSTTSSPQQFIRRPSSSADSFIATHPPQVIISPGSSSSSNQSPIEATSRKRKMPSTSTPAAAAAVDGSPPVRLPSFYGRQVLTNPRVSGFNAGFNGSQQMTATARAAAAAASESSRHYQLLQGRLNRPQQPISRDYRTLPRMPFHQNGPLRSNSVPGQAQSERPPPPPSNNEGYYRN